MWLGNVDWLISYSSAAIADAPPFLPGLIAVLLATAPPRPQCGEEPRA